MGRYRKLRPRAPRRVGGPTNYEKRMERWELEHNRREQKVENHNDKE